MPLDSHTLRLRQVKDCYLHSLFRHRTHLSLTHSNKEYLYLYFTICDILTFLLHILIKNTHIYILKSVRVRGIEFDTPRSTVSMLHPKLIESHLRGQLSHFLEEMLHTSLICFNVTCI